MPKAEYLTLTFEVQGFEPKQKTYPTGINIALENALDDLSAELNTLANLRYRYFIDAVLAEASNSAFSGMSDEDINGIVAAARAKIEAYISGTDQDFIEVCFNDTMVFTETGISQSKAFMAALEQVYPRELGFWYFDCAVTTFGLWVNEYGGRAFTANELGDDGIAHTIDDGPLETAIKTPSKEFKAGEPLPTSGLVFGSQQGSRQYNVNGKYADMGVTGWQVSDNEIYTWGPNDTEALSDPLYSLDHIANTGIGYIPGDWSDETALLWAVRYLHRIGIAKDDILTAIGMSDTSGLTAAELYQKLLAAYPQYATRLSRETATDLGKIPSVVAAYEAMNAIEGKTGEELVAAVTAARKAFNDINLNGQVGLKKSFLQGYFGRTEPYKTAYRKLVEAEQALNIQPPEPATPAEALAGVLPYLAATVPEPVVGSEGGEWAVLAMARGGVITDAIKTAYLGNLAGAGNQITNYTDYERVTIALSALGIDASDFGGEDEVHQDLTASFKEPTDGQTLNVDIFALLALNAMRYGGSQAGYVTRLCAAALGTGGWNLSSSAEVADVDTTAMAIQALAPYYDTDSAVKAKVDAALTWLKAQQDSASGGFKNYNGTVSTCSTAQVVTALCALGIDPNGKAWTVDGMTPLSALTLWYDREGWFGETDTSPNQMATEQAAYALVAWDRYKNNRRSLYDMRDAFNEPASTDASVRSLTVCGVDATVDANTDNTYNVELPYDTDLTELTADDFVIRPAICATNSVPERQTIGADSAVWTFTVTAEDPSTEPVTYTVNITLAAAPNAENQADVNAAATAIGAKTLNKVSSATANTEADVRTWIGQQIKSDLTEHGVTASVEITDFLEATDGTPDAKPGASGSFKATITISKGTLNTPEYAFETLEITNGVIEQVVYVSSDPSVYGVKCNGKDGVINGQDITIILPHTTETLPTEASDFDVYTVDKDTTFILLKEDGETWNLKTLAEDEIHSLEYTILVSIAADPLSGAQQTVENAKAAIENHTFTVPSTTANTKEAVADWLQTELDKLASTVTGRTITGLTVKPAEDGKAGSSDTWAGTNGSFSFTVSLSLDYPAGKDASGAPYDAGTITETTATIKGTITAEPYTPSKDVSVLSLTIDGATVGAEDTNHNFAAVLPYGTELDSLTEDDFNISLAKGATRTKLSKKDGGATWTFTVTAENGTAKQTYTVSVSVSTDSTAYDQEQNEAAVAAAKKKLPAEMTASYKNVSNAQTARAFVLQELDKLGLGEGVTASVTISGFVASVGGTATDTDGTDGSFTAKVTLSKGSGATLVTAEATISVTITASAYVDLNGDIVVTFRLIGAYPAEQGVDLSKDPYMPEYVTWIPSTDYTIPIGSTMYDLFTLAMEKAGLESVGAKDGYVETIYAPDVLTGYKLSEFTNGANSGWMYTVNGKTAGVGLTDYYFSSDDDTVATNTAIVVWHYVNDWYYEQSDYSQTLGDASTWDKWLDAPDVEPTAVPASKITLNKSSVTIAEDATVTLKATVLPSYALNKTVTWTSSDESVATVKNGKVTAVSAGTATITAAIGKVTAACKVTVTEEEAPEVDVTFICEDEEEPIAEVTSVVETIVDASGKETKTATITVDSTWINDEGEVEDTPCVVIVQKSDGSYERLEAESNEDGSYSFVKEGYAEDMEFFVAVMGDTNGDGKLSIADMLLARAAMLGKASLDEVAIMISDLDGKNGLTIADIIKARAYSLNMTALDW